jgi:putative transposase
VETGAFGIMPNHVHGIIFIVERRGTVSVLLNNQPLNKLEPPNLNEIWEQGGETPPLRVPTFGQVVAYFKYQSTKEMNTLENTGTVTKF